MACEGVSEFGSVWQICENLVIVHFKVTVRPDWICMRVVSLESPLKGHQPLFVLIFYFLSWIFDKSSKFWAASCKKAFNPPACSVHGLHMLKPRSFSPNRAPKMRERHQLFLGCGLHPSFCNPNQNRGALWRIFSSNESAPATSKTGFYADRWTSRRLESFLHEKAQNFEV